MSYGAVIFDCDGVLVDSEVIAIEVEVAALARVGVQLTAVELAQRYVGVSGPAMRSSVAREFGIDLTDSFWATLREDSHAALAGRVRAIPGMRQVIQQLGLPYALASSSSHDRVVLTLGTAGLLDLFDDSRRFSAQDVEHGKPAPDLFLHAAAALGVAPGSCVVVEDSPYGVAAALAAGMDVVGFTAGGHADDAWAQRLRDAGAARIAANSGELTQILRAGRP
ncbi:MAG: HAD family hydrolase [Euzebya sp.]